MDNRELLISQMRDEYIRCKGSSTVDKKKLKAFFEKINEPIYKGTKIFDKGTHYTSMKWNSDWSGSDDVYNITISKFLKTYGHLATPATVPAPVMPSHVSLTDLKKISIIPHNGSIYNLKDLRKCLESLDQRTVFSADIPFGGSSTIELRGKGEGSDNERWAIEDRLQHKDNIQVTIDNFINTFSKSKKKTSRTVKIPDISNATIVYDSRCKHTTTDLRDLLENRGEIVGFNCSYNMEHGDTIEKEEGNWLFQSSLLHSSNDKYTLDEFIDTFGKAISIDPKKVIIAFERANVDELIALGKCVKKLGHDRIFTINHALTAPTIIQYNNRDGWRADDKPKNPDLPRYSIHDFINTFGESAGPKLVPVTATPPVPYVNIHDVAITFESATKHELKALGEFLRTLGQDTVFNEAIDKKSEYRSIEFNPNSKQWTMYNEIQNDDHVTYSIADFMSVFGGSVATATLPTKPMREYIISRDNTTQNDLTELKDCLKAHGEPTSHFSTNSTWSATHYDRKKDKWVGTKKESNISVHEFLSMFGTRGVTTTSTTNIGNGEPKPKPKAKPKPILWKNPKPKIKNAREITLGNRVFVNGKSVTCTALDFLDDKVKVEIRAPGLTSTEFFNKEDVYPLFMISEFSDAKIGDLVILIGDNISGIITKVDKTKDFSILVNNKWYKSSDINTLYSLIPPVRIYQKFACGTLEYNGREFQTVDEMKAANVGMKFKATNVENSREHTQIASHYGMNVADVIPKETEIMNTLKTALDHPLNVAQKEWALMYGGSGSGKTRVCVDYAKSVGRDYVLQQGSQQLTVDDLVGYKSITDGTYFPSLLRDAVENGKVFILDEMDACNPNTLLALNSLKQDEYQFPDKLIPIHKNFRLLATANTLEYSEEYNARSPLDKATRARFKTIAYDMADHELALRYGLKYVKQIQKIDRLTPRDVARDVVALRIQEG